LIKAKSRHASLRTLERYVNTSNQTIAPLTDRHYPIRGRGWRPHSRGQQLRRGVAQRTKRSCAEAAQPYRARHRTRAALPS
jgi:hypothetical protein